MEELKKIETGMVPVYETSTGEKVVYGTELHGVLETKSNYREWVKRSHFFLCDFLGLLHSFSYRLAGRTQAAAIPSILTVIHLLVPPM